MQDLRKLKEKFILEFGNSKNEISFTIAPARVNIIGEHIDYNGGLVFPAAINLNLIIAFRKRTDKKILYKTLKKNTKHKFSIEDDFSFETKNNFANYLNGVIKYLKEQGLNLNCGFEILISSTIPGGSGLSSSAALELCFAECICTNFNFNIEKLELAKLGMRVENEFLNLHSGIMDQAIIALAKKDTAILLNTANLAYEYIPLKISPFIIAVMNSNKPRKLTESKYNERKEECDLALAFFKKRSNAKFLCDLTLEIYEKYKVELINELGSKIAKRTLHCISEMKRVNLSVQALKHNNLENLGKLLIESHISLKENYEVTGKELDSLVFNAIKHEACLGARMTGAGFSGCAIALVKEDEFKSFSEFVNKAYKKETGLNAEIFPCVTCNGVKNIST